MLGGTRGRSLLLAVIAVVIAVGVVSAVPDRQAAEERQVSEAKVDTDTWYVLVNRHSGKAATTHDRDIADRAKVTQWTRDDGPWQQWQFMASEDDYYRLRNRHSNKVLADANNPFVDGGLVAQAGDHDGVEQRWRLVSSGGGHVRLINRVSGKALQVPTSSTDDGSAVDQAADGNSENQHWRLVPIGSADYPEPDELSGGLTTHDPTVIKLPGQRGYLLAGTGRGIGLKTSPDRVEWTDVGEAFSEPARWAHEYTDPDDSDLLWAPDLSYHEDRYYMYYSASTQGSFHSGIFLATSTTGRPGSWVNHGLVIESQQSDDFNAIDPNLVVDDRGRWWLAFGSYGSGLKMVQLDRVTGKRLDDKMIGIADRSNGSANRFYGPQEAAFIFKRGAYYYLYMSFDRCCNGTESDYRVMVARSTSPTGPYVDRDGFSALDGGGTEILAGHGDIRGPGHQAVLADTDGDILFYHYYAGSGVGEPACGYCTLGVNHLGYDDHGWPFVERAERVLRMAK
jgi:arabinan endo-1,5-alpha-L-arabinosidase